jgi:hypothetical protein
MEKPRLDMIRKYWGRASKRKCPNCGRRKKTLKYRLCFKCRGDKREWARQHRAEIIPKQKAYRVRTRREAIEAYGGRCSCCGEQRLEFLTINHTKNDGARHRRALGNQGRGHAFYLWLKTNYYPTGFDVRCWNCNCAQGLYGYCPHKKESRRAA